MLKELPKQCNFPDCPKKTEKEAKIQLIKLNPGSLRLSDGANTTGKPRQPPRGWKERTGLVSLLLLPAGFPAAPLTHAWPR